MNRIAVLRFIPLAIAAAAIVACDDDDPIAPELNPPTGVAATQVTSTSIRVTWGAVSGATSYLVQRAPGSTGGTFTQVGGGLVTGTALTDNVPAPGTFRYRVAAVRGSDTSSFGAVITATTTETFMAELTGAKERPDPRLTPAEGEAEITFRNDTLRWTIDMTQITNVTAAHIHIGHADTAGGIILNLAGPNATGYSSTGPSNTQISGFVTRAGFPAPGSPNQAITFDDLLTLMRAGNAYVNVHTNDNVAPTNTGPGDFPGGEIRGQTVRQGT